MTTSKRSHKNSKPEGFGGLRSIYLKDPLPVIGTLLCMTHTKALNPDEATNIMNAGVVGPLAVYAKVLQL